MATTESDMDDVEQAKRLLAGGDWYAFSGTKGVDTLCWYVFNSWVGRPYLPGGEKFDPNSLILGPFSTDAAAREFLSSRYDWPRTNKWMR